MQCIDWCRYENSGRVHQILKKYLTAKQLISGECQNKMKNGCFNKLLVKMLKCDLQQRCRIWNDVLLSSFFDKQNDRVTNQIKKLQAQVAIIRKENIPKYSHSKLSNKLNKFGLEIQQQYQQQHKLKKQQKRQNKQSQKQHQNQNTSNGNKSSTSNSKDNDSDEKETPSSSQPTLKDVTKSSPNKRRRISKT